MGSMIGVEAQSAQGGASRHWIGFKSVEHELGAEIKEVCLIGDMFGDVFA